MIRKSFVAVFSLITCLTLNLLSFNSSHSRNSREELLKEDVSLASGDIKAAADETIITVHEIALYLNKKKEHYPLSDEFIEKYQQTSGGYIATAIKLGHLVDKEQHEPNQKWHFFDSWLWQSIEDGTLTWEADAKSSVYNRLLCPELLLWLFEACGADPDKVYEAMKVAQVGKVNKTNVSTIAKNMRLCVPWADLYANIRA